MGTAKNSYLRPSGRDLHSSPAQAEKCQPLTAGSFQGVPHSRSAAAHSGPRQFGCLQQYFPHSRQGKGGKVLWKVQNASPRPLSAWNAKGEKGQYAPQSRIWAEGPFKGKGPQRSCGLGKIPRSFHQHLDRCQCCFQTQFITKQYYKKKEL